MKPTHTTKTIRIDGMTCVSCQPLIEKKVGRLSGVRDVRVDWGEGTARVDYDPARTSATAIEAAIEEAGYRVTRGGVLASASLRSVALALGAIVGLFVLLDITGLLNTLAPQQLADGSMGYAMLFTIGLVTSVHCIAMCGGINLSQALPSSRADDGVGSRAVRRAGVTFMPALLYNGGRVVSYTIGGFLLGGVGLIVGGGGTVGLSPMLQGVLKLVAGAVMIAMGIGMLGLFPQIRRHLPRLPRSVTDRLGSAASSSRRPFVVGLLNGFMPCGPLQSMQIVALASADPFVGALSMFLFALGTVPLMFGLGSIVSALGARFMRPVMTVGSVLVVVLGLAMVSQGGSLSGLIPPHVLVPSVVALAVVALATAVPVRDAGRKLALVGATALIAAVVMGFWISATALSGGDGARVRIVDGVQVVSTTLERGRYANLTVQAGMPVRWEIDAAKEAINGCNNRFMIPTYGIEHLFVPGQNVVEFTPNAEGVVPYACWMGMIKGSITVVQR